MKAAMTWGDMGADETDDQYPQVALCDDCFAELMKDPENSGIVDEVTYDQNAHGTSCSRCGCEDS